MTHDVPPRPTSSSASPRRSAGGQSGRDPDELVETFFADLTDAVKRHASSGGEECIGIYDRAIPIGSDLEKLTTRALSAAQVFVPLYSVAYLNNSWPGRELTCFRKRVEQAGRDNPEGRFVPVLWTPLAGVKDPPGLRESLAHRVTVPDYADNGLRVLLKLPSYHDLYRVVMDRWRHRSSRCGA